MAKLENPAAASELPSVEDLLKILGGKCTTEQLGKIELAWNICQKAHTGQKRISGEDYAYHPLSVALILTKELGYFDVDSIIAALLHDTYEDTLFWIDDNKDISNNDKITKTIEKIDSFFGKEVTDIVLALSELKSKNRNKDLQTSKDAYFVNITSNADAVLVKAADRIHNLRTLPKNNEVFKAKILKDTEENIFSILEFVRRPGINDVYQKSLNISIKIIEAEVKKNKK